MTEHLKTAIVTGGCSGIGLGLVHHLLSLPTPQWRVILADIRQDSYASISSTLDPTRHLFIHTDVSSWDSQTSLFRQAYVYSKGQIDFFAANAGTAEREHITLGNPLAPEDVDGEPIQPTTLCTQVNQIGVYYGLKLFVHYARRTTKRLKSESESTNGTTTSATTDPSTAFTPKMVITSSCSALYPFAPAPEYCMTKHAVLALTRSVAPVLWTTDKIALNCIMPAYVATSLAPIEVTDLWPKEYITPIETMLRAFSELTHPTGHVSDTALSDGIPNTIKIGQSVECVVDKLYYRQPVAYADESQRFLIEQGLDLGGIWWQGLGAAMEKMARQQQQARGTSLVDQAGVGTK